MRVLIADDYKEHVDDLVSAAANNFDCEARGCMTGQEALALCESWSPHLVIYDSLMDGMRAWQFGFRLLRSDPPQHQRPYLVALTHLTSRLQRSLCEEVGFDEYKAKPITPEELDGWIEKARKKEIYFA